MTPEEMLTRPKWSGKKLEYYYYMQVAQKRVECEVANLIWINWGLPREWHDIALSPKEGKREKVTLYLDANVMKFFRTFGRGTHARVNDVLKVWMYGRLTKLIRGPDSNDLFGKDGLFGTRPPKWEEAYDAGERIEKMIELARTFGRKD